MRVEKDRALIREEDTFRFFEQRAKMKGLKYDINRVLYQDKQPELALKRHNEELNSIASLLTFHAQDKVIDIGCGIGRWGHSICPIVKKYTGIDFSPSLTEQALANLSGFHNAECYCLGATELTDKKIENNAPYTKAILAGLLIYMNDANVEECLYKLASIMSHKSKIYIRDPVSIAERLTLVEHWSDELNSSYNAVYRTREEVINFIDMKLTPAGFNIMFDQPLFKDELVNRTETKPWAFILERA